MKKFLSLFLVISLSLVVTFSITNNTPITLKNREDIQEKRKNLTFNKDILVEDISTMSDEMILELTKQEGEIVSISQTTKTLHTDETKMMSKTDFTMTVVVQKINTENKVYDTFKFIVEGDWKTAPFYEFTDAITLAWSNEFTLKNDDAYIVYTDGKISRDDHDIIRSNVTSEAGLAYDVDLLLGKSDDKVILSATVYQHHSTGKATVIGEYGHVKIGTSDLIINKASVSTVFDY